MSQNTNVIFEKSMHVRDPCGYICVLLLYVCIGYADYVVINWILFEVFGSSIWTATHMFTFNILLFFLIIIHSKALITDPGTIQLQRSYDYINTYDDCTNTLLNTEGEGHTDNYREWTICTQCEIYRPPKAHHCRICRRCIRKRDHHCPWINNCVGEGNQKFFLQFLTYVGIISMYIIILIVYSWLDDCSNCDPSPEIQELRIWHLNILFVESLIFGLFVLLMLADQLNAIFDQSESHVPKPRLTLLQNVCGQHVHPVFWLWPLPFKFTMTMTQSFSRTKNRRHPHYIV